MKKVLFFSLLILSAVQVFSQECDNLEPEPAVNNIVIVLDKSGSMSYEPFREAQRAVSNFIDSMNTHDRAALIAFSDDVGVVSRFTSDHGRLKSAVNNLQAGGQTRLYDAVARAGQLLIGQSGVKVIVYLTDGIDNISTFTLDNIRELNIGEGVFVYGIGLGNVDHDSLRSLSSATGGRYRSTDDHTRLTGLYSEILSSHYTAAENIYATTGSFVITSIPSRMPVTIDDKRVGRTPLKVDSLQEGNHPVQVTFPTGIWECNAPAEAGYRNRITARESDLPTDLWIESAPTGAAVYLDDAYVGTTSRAPSRKSDEGVDYSNQLKIPAVPEGKHTLKLIAVPDFDFSPSQVFEFDFEIRDTSRYVKASILLQKAFWGNGEVSQGKNAASTDGEIDAGNIRNMIPDFSF